MHQPETERALAEIIAAQHAPVYLAGGDTRAIGQRPCDTWINTSHLRGITLYEPGALTLVVRAGTPIAEINAALASEGQRLAFDPPDWRSVLHRAGRPTIGGAIATNASGPARMALGAARDFLLGVCFVDGRGTVVKNGGRVMKNVTGYDLTKLMAGANGSLGVLTEVSLKVLPAPEQSVTLALSGLSEDQAIAAMSDALNTPFEVTGAAHLAASQLTVLRLEGFGASVAYRAEALAKRLTHHGAAQETTFDWATVRDLLPFAEQAGTVWRIACPPSRATEVVSALRHVLDLDVIYDWGGASVWICTPEPDDIRPLIAPWPAMCLRTSPDGPFALPAPDPVTGRLIAGLKQAFDPKGLFKPWLWEDPA